MRHVPTTKILTRWRKLFTRIFIANIFCAIINKKRSTATAGIASVSCEAPMESFSEKSNFFERIVPPKPNIEILFFN